MKKFRQIVTGLLVATGMVGVSLVGTASVGAINPIGTGCAANPNAAICDNQSDRVDAFAKDLVRILLWAIGVISVIMIVVGGLFYVISQGDAAKTKRAKDTILYAVIGLVVALLAYAIVHFVLGYL